MTGFIAKHVLYRMPKGAWGLRARLWQKGVLIDLRPPKGSQEAVTQQKEHTLIELQPPKDPQKAVTQQEKHALIDLRPPKDPQKAVTQGEQIDSAQLRPSLRLTRRFNIASGLRTILSQPCARRKVFFDALLAAKLFAAFAHLSACSGWTYG
ncbi:hypothetical protein BHAP_1605 [Bifidobacterium hapali]|uniref:Uncharacterized protein n=1 Tax=Bifidobacterium hapali TaxID=1630172 RepID=A0A261FYF5_9BIFI|nr:hypothetical protein BHAP_1605 [Bifidobacterium hapali]